MVILLFCHSILLRGVNAPECMDDSMFLKDRRKVLIEVVLSTIGSKSLDLNIKLSFDRVINILKYIQATRVQSSIKDESFCPRNIRSSGWSPNVIMDEGKRKHRLCITYWKGGKPMFIKLTITAMKVLNQNIIK